MLLTLSERQSVANVMCDEYRKASKKRSGQMLDEFFMPFQKLETKERVVLATI